MKNSGRIWLLIAVLLVVAGILVMGGALAANGWDFSSLGGGGLVTNTAGIGESFENISLEGGTEDVAFLPAEDGACRVVFRERENEPHTASVENGTLVIRSADTRKWYEHITLFSVGSPAVTVYLPQDAYASLSVKVSTGDVSVPGGFTFGEISLTADTGDVTCAASSEGALRIRTSTGAVRVENVSAGSAALTVSTGRITLRSTACEGDVEVNVSTGAAVLSDVTCRGLSSSGSTGSLTLERVVCSGALTARRSTGDIRFDACDAAELDVSTSTGDVTGTLLTDKVFIARSDTGRVDVPETVTGGKCKITTDTGRIVISIR